MLNSATLNKGLYHDPDEEEMLIRYYYNDPDNQCEERIGAIISKCEEELNQLRLLLWAAVKSNNGKLIIKDRYILGNTGVKLLRENDSKGKRIILTVQDGE